ncbi:hypothetical protein [Scandinavium goeteborgense]|uniref:Uncharacterized protein n=1 Tax=Scandinavium goeteborgense TaxID=1851514 RepID=A0A4R6EIC5_SCAGO|nr:hypothetical protein [Scandinavium goeteborgense]TDN58427.1 hypothetical protein EC847_10550 [Scandinavium goeteborgense]
MIKFDSILDILKNLKDVEITKERDDKDSVTFKKGNTKFILSKPARDGKDIQSDFSLTIGIQPIELRKNKLEYISILELVNGMNQSQGNLCTYYYNKKFNVILIDISHILFGQKSELCDNFFERNLDKYLPMAILSMMVLILESVDCLKKEIATLIEGSMEDKNEENK